MDKNWTKEIHLQHEYFFRKTGRNPTILLLSPKVMSELFHQVHKEQSFILCDWGLTKFMGCEIKQVPYIRDFAWASMLDESK